MVAAGRIRMARSRINIGDLVTDALGTLRRARQADWIADADADMVAVLRHQQVRELLNDERLGSSFPDFLRALGVTSGPFAFTVHRAP